MVVVETEQLKTEAAEKTLVIPISVLQQILDEDSSEPLEDWLMVTDPKFIMQLKKGQEDLKAGKRIPWEKVKEQLGIK